jgi:uncharacterized protein DUF2752
LSKASGLCDAAPPLQGEDRKILKHRTTFEIVFSPTGRVLAPLFLLASVFLPPHGLGFDVCLTHRLTGLPCPGCGLTRSITSLTHGQFQSAEAYHPFGIVIYLVLVALCAYSLLPLRWREAVRSAAIRRDAVVRPAYRLFIATFVAFGLLRFFLEGIFGAPRP